MLSRYVMGSALSILVFASVAATQPAFVQNAFGLQLIGTPKESPKRFALSAAGSTRPPELGAAFVVGRDSPPTGGSAQIKLQRIDHTGSTGQQGVLGWSRLLPTQPGQTDADGISVITDKFATKVFVTGWYKSGTGKNIIVMGYDGAGNTLWPAPFTYSTPDVTGDDVPVQIEWNQFSGFGGDPALNAVYVGGTAEGVATGATLGRDIVVFKLKETDGTPFNVNWAAPFRFNGAGNGPDTFSEFSVQHRRCVPEGGEPSEYNRIYVGGTSYQGVINKNDYVIISIDGTTALASTPTLYNSPNSGDDYLTSLDALAFYSPQCQIDGTVAVTGYSNGTSPGDGTDDFVTIAYNLDSMSPSFPGPLVPKWGGPLGPTRVYDGADSSTSQGTDHAIAVKLSTGAFYVFVTGSSWGGTSEGFNVATIGYAAADGIKVWDGPPPFLPGGVALFNHPSASAEDRAMDLIVDKADNIYVAGFSYTGSSKDYFAISYLPFNGQRRWQVCTGTAPIPTADDFVTVGGIQNGSDTSGSIRVSRYGSNAIDHVGDVYLYGLFTNTGNQFTVVKYRQSDDENGCPTP